MLNTVAGKIVELRVRDYKCPPGGSGIALRQAELSIILHNLDNVLNDCPPHLVLSRREATSPECNTFPDYLIDDMPQYAQGSRLFTDEPRRSYIIQQANLYITQVSDVYICRREWTRSALTVVMCKICRYTTSGIPLQISTSQVKFPFTTIRFETSCLIRPARRHSVSPSRADR